MNQNAGHTVNSNNGHKRRRLETNGHVPNVNPQPAIPPRSGPASAAATTTVPHNNQGPQDDHAGPQTHFDQSNSRGPITPLTRSSPPPYYTLPGPPPQRVGTPLIVPPPMNAGLAPQHLLSISEWVTKLSHYEVRELLADAATRHQDVFWALANEFRRTEAARIEGQNKVLARVWSTCYYDQPSQGFAQLAPEHVRAAEQAAGEQEEDDDDDDDEDVLDFSQYPTKVKHLLVEKWKHLSLYALLHKHDAATEMIMDIVDTIVDQVSSEESSYGTKANALLTLFGIATIVLKSPGRLALEVRKNLLCPRFYEKTGDLLERFYLDEAKTFFRTQEYMKVLEDFFKIPREKEFGTPVMPGMESIMSTLERWSGYETDDES